MLAAPLALLGALVWGAADFLGGLAAQRLRAIVVTATAAATGLALLVLLHPFVDAAWNADDLWFGALSGAAAAVAIALLYATLALGPMSVLSPLTAVVCAVAPMLWGLLVDGERLSSWGYAGLAVAVVAIVLVALLPGERITRPSVRALVMAVGAGLAFGAFLILLDQTSSSSGVVPLIMNRLVSSILTGTIVGMLVLSHLRRGGSARAALIADDAGIAAGPSGHADLHTHPIRVSAPRTAPRRPLRQGVLVAMGCGLLDAGANVLLLVALRIGDDLAVVSALTALYPAGTVVLAALVLRERIAAVQWVGLALALAAGALLALG